MLKTIIIDDEPNSIDVLTHMLENFCPTVQVVGASGDASTGISLIKKLSPDLVFLDIEMPYHNGFSVLEQLVPVSFEIVFVTAFEQYAHKAFKYNAIDYLLKPVSIEELQRTVEKVSSRLKEKAAKSSFIVQKLCLPIQNGFLFVSIDDIIRCEADGSYTRFFLVDSEPILASRNLKEYEDLLPAEVFCRVHHSQLINVNHVTKYTRDKNGFIHMIDGSVVELSVRKKNSFFAYFNLQKR